MIEKIFIISLIVFGIYATFQEEMIFEAYGQWIEKTFGEFWCKPLGCCITCFTFWMGHILYMLIYMIVYKGGNFKEGIIVVVCSMGLNYILTRMFTDEQSPPTGTEESEVQKEAEELQAIDAGKSNESEERREEFDGL